MLLKRLGGGLCGLLLFGPYGWQGTITSSVNVLVCLDITVVAGVQTFQFPLLYVFSFCTFFPFVTVACCAAVLGLSTNFSRDSSLLNLSISLS